MRRHWVLIAAMAALGCSKSDPGKLQDEVTELRKAQANAQAEKLALEKEIAAYRADLEHERFLNQELKRKVKELQEVQRITDLARMLPQAGAEERQKALAPPQTPPARPGSPAPISAAITVASAVPSAPPPAPAAPAEPTPKPSHAEAPPPAASQEAEHATAAQVEQKKSQVSPPTAPTRAEAPRKEIPPPKPEPVAKPAEVTPPPPAAKPSPEAPQQQQAKKPEAKAPSSPAPSARQEAELQLLNLVNRREGQKLVLAGEVRNNTNLPAANIVVTARLYDQHNSVVREVRIPVLSNSSLQGKRMADFEVQVPWDERVGRCVFEVEGTQKVNVSRRD